MHPVTPHPRFTDKRRKAMALVLVIITVALLAILIIAIFSITRTEYKATQNFVAARGAKQYADFAIAITQSQLQNAQNTGTTASQRTIHATQPGMVRVYAPNGDFQRAFKLYSSSSMTISGNNEAEIFSSQNQVPSDWNSVQNRARYVDLNEPVVRPGLTQGRQALYFPIIDPRAAFTGTNPATGTPLTAVEGFTYSKSTPAVVGGGGPVTYQEVVMPTEAGADPSKMRLPMPVEWLYILQDGTIGALDNSNKFVSANSSVKPSSTNPIVGRVAFWTDDESCKINVNTAAEPTFMAPPFFYSERDYQWANFPGAAGEYQRYPGHPATVALSSVLAPGMRLDPIAPGASIPNIVTTKEYIYNLMPKIPTGGSMSGTLPFQQDDFSSINNEQQPATMADAAAARSERLFASVDEMLFRDTGFDASNGRVAARYELPGGGGRLLFDRDSLERSRFFLTANSRAPEFSMFGLPRVAMWPIPDETLGQNRRTSFDNMIALCATLRSATTGAAVTNSYVFRRAQAHHATHDVTGSSSAFGSSQSLARNSKLLDYLYTQMTSLQFPQISNLGSSSNFGTKYGQQNAAQLAVEFFDYIRCTNLYDGVLARENEGMDGQSPTSTALYVLNDNKEGTQYTYTNHRVSPRASGNVKGGRISDARLGNLLLSDDSKVFPGHGQVTPAVWQKNGASLRGFGRMFTISEVGFQFICTADGKNDQYAVVMNGQASGGGSAPRADPTVDSESPVYQPSNFVDENPANDRMGRWYSNFPPLLPQPGEDPNPPMLYGVTPTPANGPRHPARHPGYDPNNWNMTLANRTPLLPDEKRVQAMLMLETFCPMLGWTKFYPEYSIVLDGNFISGIKLNGQALYDTTQDIVIKSNTNLYEAGDVYSLGGHAGPTAMAGQRGARPVSGTGRVLMPSDALFVTGNTTGHNALTNYGVNSNFITVKRNQPMQLSFGTKEFVIRIYDKHRYQELGLQPVQIIRIRFDDSPLPMPALVYSPQRVLSGTNKVDALNNELNYYKRTDQFGRIIYWRSLQGPHWWCLNYEGCIGRLKGQANPLWTGSGAAPFWIQAPVPYAPGDDMTPLRQTLLGRLNTSAARVDGPPGTAQALSIIPFERMLSATSPIDEDTNQPWSGSDVIRTMVPAVGDYRLIAARYDVPASMWMRHPLWTADISKGLQARKTLHTFTTHWAHTENGVQLPSSASTQQLVANVPYDGTRQPDLPPDPTGAFGTAANSFGDFDNGIANSRDGAYVNKPDEGNFYAGNFTRNNITRYYRSGYFFEPWHNSDDWRSGVYMTPNRMVTSPVMFGSLSTGVWPGGSVSTSALTGTSGLSFNDGKPWQTLLFRPYSQSTQIGKAVVPGHPGDNNPRDHFLLDMFFMPVVEPYAISEPLSVAGRINLNYQIVPFTNITRATGLHALMKGEFITAIPNGDVNNAKNYAASRTYSNQNWDRNNYWNEQQDRKFWHRPINVAETLKQFDEKFTHSGGGQNHNTNRYRGLFRSASQICEVHLIPDVSQGASAGGEVLPSATMSNFTASNRQTAMDLFWRNHSPTGDNTRERPYSNLYSRVTTRSNTFRVHMRAQTLRKARSTEVDVFDPAKDAVLGEYRGSALVERYIDPTDTSNPIPDYGAASNPLQLPPLETFYKFRTLEYKRFSP